MARLGAARVPTLVALVIATFGLLEAWVFGTFFDEDACRNFGSLPEGTRSTTQLTLWPPGSWNCEFTTPGGRTVDEAYFPAASYLFSLYLAAASGLIVWAVQERTPTVAGYALTGLILVAALMMLVFLSEALSAAVAVVALVSWVAIAIVGPKASASVDRTR